ncbi:phage head closure protein [Tissierella pigra]|uniref:phage head closure protein n=1 Tax=Tissierella pigra TaxID=2607614 RepID=UPI001C0FED88|nr:phage head closure protein [Tissierella pigra]MBU5425012.1 phage head closure protein [Tissierella pigra]
MKDKRMAMKDVNKVFDAYVTFQKKKKQEGPIPNLGDYEDYISLWAESRFLRGKNFYAARAANVKTDVEFIIRYRTDLDEKMRIKFDNKFYEIEGILPLDNTRSYLLVKAYEIKHDM